MKTYNLPPRSTHPGHPSIHGSFVASGPETTMGWLELAIFSNFGRHVFGTFRVQANIIMQRHEMPYRLSSDFPVTLKCLTFFDIKMLFCAKSVSTSFFCFAFEDNYVKTNEDTPMLSATKVFARYSSF